ncbi:MAG: hypothetical protein QNJ98_12755 [Planctomycetota bacterium]|nr:hypothetical protein [Planctomycetota bacterium]
MYLVLALLVLLMLLPYVLGPVLVRRQFRHRKEPEVVKVGLDDMPREAQAYIAEAEEALIALGFEPVGRVRLNTVPNAVAWGSLLLHRTNRDLANIAAAGPVVGGDATVIEQRHTEFMTQWKERELLTNNCQQAQPFGPVRGQAVVSFMDMDDLELLYRIHRARVVAQDAETVSLMPVPGMELDVIADASRSFIEAQEQRGNVRLLDDGETYGLTWRAAFKATWKQLWPFQGMELTETRENARRLLTTLDIEVPEDQVTPSEPSSRAVASQSA